MAFVAESHAANNGGQALSKPTGTVSGDIMIAVVVAAFGDADITPPSGWTLLQTEDQESQFLAEMRVYKKVAGGSEPSTYTWGISGQGGGNDVGINAILTYRGETDVDTSVAILVDSTSDTNRTMPSITPSASGATIVAIYCGVANSPISSAPAGFSTRLDYKDVVLTGYTIFAFDKVHTSGATGTITAISSNSNTGGGVGGCTVALAAVVTGGFLSRNFWWDNL